jgi:hypothetical protein
MTLLQAVVSRYSASGSRDSGGSNRSGSSLHLRAGRVTDGWGSGVSRTYTSSPLNSVAGSVKLSSMVSTSETVSAPSPVDARPVPLFPLIVSSPCSPRIVSFDPPPRRMSAPSPPRIVSATPLPSMMSLPSWPRIHAPIKPKAGSTHRQNFRACQLHRKCPSTIRNIDPKRMPHQSRWRANRERHLAGSMSTLL